jgi:hypothetical protein
MVSIESGLCLGCDDLDAIEGDLAFRFARPGDTFWPRGIVEGRSDCAVTASEAKQPQTRGPLTQLEACGHSSATQLVEQARFAARGGRQNETARGTGLLDSRVRGNDMDLRASPVSSLRVGRSPVRTRNDGDGRETFPARKALKSRKTRSESRRRAEGADASSHRARGKRTATPWRSRPSLCYRSD